MKALPHTCCRVGVPAALTQLLEINRMWSTLQDKQRNYSSKCQWDEMTCMLLSQPSKVTWRPSVHLQLKKRLCHEARVHRAPNLAHLLHWEVDHNHEGHLPSSHRLTQGTSYVQPSSQHTPASAEPFAVMSHPQWQCASAAGDLWSFVFPFSTKLPPSVWYTGSSTAAKCSPWCTQSLLTCSLCSGCADWGVHIEQPLRLKMHMILSQRMSSGTIIWRDQDNSVTEAFLGNSP